MKVRCIGCTVTVIGSLAFGHECPVTSHKERREKRNASAANSKAFAGDFTEEEQEFFDKAGSEAIKAFKKNYASMKKKKAPEEQVDEIRSAS